MTTRRVVPLPVEDPEHLSAVFVSVSVVWLVFVPVGERRQMAVPLPVPVVGRHLALAGQTYPEIAVLRSYRRRQYSDSFYSATDMLSILSEIARNPIY